MRVVVYFFPYFVAVVVVGVSCLAGYCSLGILMTAAALVMVAK